MDYSLKIFGITNKNNRLINFGPKFNLGLNNAPNMLLAWAKPNAN